MSMQDGVKRALRAARDTQEITDQQIADRLGRTLQEIEAVFVIGQQVPAEALRQVSEVLGLNFAELMAAAFTGRSDPSIAQFMDELRAFAKERGYEIVGTGYHPAGGPEDPKGFGAVHAVKFRKSNAQETSNG